MSSPACITPGPLAGERRWGEIQAGSRSHLRAEKGSVAAGLPGKPSLDFLLWMGCCSRRGTGA